jgi:DNA-binding NarL/FixJ family response regulator
MHIRVLIVDDSPLMQVGLARCLEPDPGLEVVGTADGGHEGLQLAHELRPDVILLDLQMPEVTGMVVLERLRDELPDIRTLVVTASEKAESLLDAVAAGAAGYLSKRSTPEEVRQAVITVHGGGSVITPVLAGHLLNAYSRRSGGPGGGPGVRPLLSKREQEVLRLVAQGHTDKEVALTLHVSPRTVQTHLAHIREKTGMRRRAELARWAADHTFL